MYDPGALQLRTTDIVQFRESRPVSTWLPLGGCTTRLPGIYDPRDGEPTPSLLRQHPAVPRLTADERFLAKGLLRLPGFGWQPGFLLCAALRSPLHSCPISRRVYRRYLHATFLSYSEAFNIFSNNDVTVLTWSLLLKNSEILWFPLPVRPAFSSTHP